MADPPPRLYRAGLGLPAAKIISSPSILPPNAQPRLYDPSDDPGPSTWREWNINPAKHGPARLTAPPVFVSGTGTYDELGRSIGDGVGVEVDEGIRRRRGERDGEAMGGEEVKGWYLGLASRSSTPVVDPPARAATPRPPQPRAAPPRQPSTSSHDVKPPVDGAARHPIKIRRNEWFIRRALLSAANNDSDDSTGQPAPPLPPSSIGGLLNLEAARDNRPKKAPAKYVLGPDNKGHQLLRGTFRWEGGGLGRPEGWVPVEQPNGEGHAGQHVPTEDAAEDVKPELDPNGQPIVDLTLSSSDSEAESDEPGESGPGRTAPIATSLKLDRLGIGHRRARPKGQEAVVKRVTHSAKEIAEAQRRARFSARRSDGKSAAAAGDGARGGKVKWKDREKRERDERRRLLAALNA